MKVTKVHPILALTQPFPYWMVHWYFPLQIVWISLSHSPSRSLFPSLSLTLSLYIPLYLPLLLYAKINLAKCYHKIKYDLKGHFYVAWLKKISDLLIKLQPWLTFLWTTFVLVYRYTLTLFFCCLKGNFRISVSIYLILILSIYRYTLTFFSCSLITHSMAPPRETGSPLQ